MRRVITVLVFACLASLAWGQSSVNESLETVFYWVDAVAGSDNNPGSQAAPFQTIGKATLLAETNNQGGVGTIINVTRAYIARRSP